MVLASNSNPEFGESPAQVETQSFIVSNLAVIYSGAYLGILSGTGHVSNVRDVAGMVPVGFAQDTATGDTAATPPVEVPVSVGGPTGVGFTVATLSGALHIGESVFATDENTFTRTASTNLPRIGHIVRHRATTTGDVRFYSMEENRGAMTA